MGDAAEVSGRGSVSQSTANVLLVDDEELIITLSQRALERFGYAVEAFADPQEALDAFAIRPAHFDVVVTDQTMPGMTGMELLARIRRVRPEIPVILCTGYSEMLDEDSAKQMGVDVFLSKPIPIRGLVTAIESVLERHRH